MPDPRPDLALHLALGAALAQNGARQVLSTLPPTLLGVGPLAPLWTAVVRCDQAEVLRIVARLVGAAPEENVRALDMILMAARAQADGYRVEATSRRAALAARQMGRAEYAAELERLGAELRGLGQKKETA